MQAHKGRLVDHIHLRCRGIAASKRFYKAVLEALGIPVRSASESHLAADELWLDAVDGPTSRIHLAFQARDREMVHRFHAAALAADGEDHAEPGERAYHPGHYAAFVLDPDGNNIEAVHHGSAPS
jgi:catechol 2,3-dioxygenase-like lactoylglutathione lyase family enzyme